MQPNPTVEYAREGVKRAIESQADFIWRWAAAAPLDTAKGIAHGAANPDVDIWKFWSGEEKVQKSMPVGVILTISAAGSETNASSVLTNKATGS